jgi:dolichol kinase
MAGGFWLNEILQTGTLGGVAYVSGRLAEAGVKVSYTRKIAFFAIFLTPLLFAQLLPFHKSPLTLAVRLAVGVGMFLILVAPVRRRVPVCATMFRSFDRPEDRPHTLFWLSTQVLGSYAVLTPMSFLFASRGISELTFVPVLIHGLGDGLAEPVGVRWGRHKYAVRALFGRERRFTRSLEGSACVFLAGLLAVLLFDSSFTGPQLLAALLVVPILSTLAEARAPHTWDTPSMFLAGTASLLAITALV